MDLYQWIFNTTRTPCLGSDEMEKFPGNNYMVVLRRGHVFKVSLEEGGKAVSYEKIRDTMEAILDTVDVVEWAGVMTTDERDSWAWVRTLSQIPGRTPLCSSTILRMPSEFGQPFPSGKTMHRMLVWSRPAVLG